MPPFYGARTLVDRPVPNGAVFIADTDHGGHDSHEGTSSSPLCTWPEAMRRVPDGGTIVGRGGTWLTTIEPPRQKQFTIMSAPGERAIITGRRTRDPWYPFGSGLWLIVDQHQVIPHDVPTPVIVDPANPWAPYPLQVWSDGVPLERVGSPQEVVGRMRFCHLESAGQLFIGVDPTSHEITVGEVERGFIGSSGRVDLLGVTFDGFVTRPYYLGAVIVQAEGSVLEDVEVKRCSASGLFVNQVGGVRISHATLFNNGQLGGRAYTAVDLQLTDSYLALNNYRGFATGQAAGAFKADTRCHRGRVHHNKFVRNMGHGFWSDITSDDLDFWRNVGNGGHSLAYVETDKRACLAGNWAEDMQVGLYTSGSREVEKWNNTYVNCQQDNRTQTDSRAENEFGFDHDDYRSFNEMHMRTDIDSGAAMLVWHDTHGGNRRTVADVHFVAEGGRYYRRELGCGNVVGATMGLGVYRTFAHLEDAVSATGLERSGLEHVGPENPFMDPATGLAIGQAKGQGVPLTPHVRQLLELPADEAAAPDAGWYGPEYIPPPMEDPAMYDTEPLTEADFAVGVAIQEIIAEVRRLETALATAEAERQEHAEARWILALALNDANTRIDTLEASLEESDELLGEARSQLDQTRADLAACEAAHGPELEPIIVGGSHQQGWPALKTMLGETPDAFRQFIGTPRVSAGSLTITQAVQADGAIPYVSVTKPANVANAAADAQYNADQWIAAGVADHAGVVIPIHEMTQKISGADFKQVLAAAMPIYRDRLTNWKRLICFMRADFLVAESDPRHPIHYLPDDLSLIDGIAVDLYDKGNADANGNGAEFGDLMGPIETFAQAHGLVIHVLECSAPDQGQRPGSPPVTNPRRKDWKADFTVDAWEHMADPTSVLADGRRLYGTFLTFNSTEGGDSPAAVPANPAATPPQPEVPAGWRYDTTPSSLAAFAQVLHASRTL